VAPSEHTVSHDRDAADNAQGPDPSLEMQLTPDPPLPPGGAEPIVDAICSPPLHAHDPATPTASGVEDICSNTEGGEVTWSGTLTGHCARSNSLPEESRNMGGGDTAGDVMDTDFLKTKPKGRSEDSPQRPKRLKQMKHGKLEPPLTKGTNIGARRAAARMGRI
jgi:hypothetical protein